jgi:transposase-like protein
MAVEQKPHTAAFKAQVALAAVRGDRTLGELAAHYGVHRTFVLAWKRQLLTASNLRDGCTPQARTLACGLD